MASHNDGNAMRNIDSANMAMNLSLFPDQLQEATLLYKKAPCNYHAKEIKNVVIIGMGGSAIGGDLLRSIVEGEMEVPLIVSRGYSLPNFVNRDTLIIAVSYSGNTEETLSAFQQGLEEGALIYSITSGGKLKELSDRFDIPYALVPGGLPPRCSLGYLFIPALLAIADTGLIDLPGEDLEKAVQTLKVLSEIYAPHSPREENPAKQLALEMQDMTPVIYGSSGTTEAAAMRWKTQLNENSKTFAAYNVVPEMNHNEIAGWEATPDMSSHTIAVFLRDRDEHPSVGKRIEINNVILQEKGLVVREFWSQGESRLARLLSLVYLGDYASYYLALLYEIDPTPVEIIEALKRKLAQ